MALLLCCYTNICTELAQNLQDVTGMHVHIKLPLKSCMPAGLLG